MISPSLLFPAAGRDSFLKPIRSDSMPIMQVLYLKLSFYMLSTKLETRLFLRKEHFDLVPMICLVLWGLGIKFGSFKVARSLVGRFGSCLF